MRLTYVLSSAILAVAIPGCAPRPVSVRPTKLDHGSFALVYRTDTFAGAGFVAEVVAIKDDGLETVLEVERDARADRPGAVAWGSLAPGRYRALALRLASGPGGTRGDRFEVPVAFTAASGQGRAVLLDLAPGELGVEDEEPSADAVARARVAGDRAPALLGVVPLRQAGALVLFDRVTGEVGGAVPTGRGPVAATIDVLASRAYVALSGEDAVEIVDLAAPASLWRVPLAIGDEPIAIARSADGRTVVTANRGSGTVSIVDTNARLERSRVSVGDRPVSLAVDPDGRTAYVAVEAPASVVVVDLGTASVLARIPVEPGPVRLRLDATGRRIVVAHRDARAVLVLDAATRSVVRRIPLDSPATAIALDPRSDRFYVARRGGLMVEVFDPGSPFPTRGFPVNGDVGFLEVDPEGNTLCMVLPDRGEVRLVRLVGGQQVARLGIGPGPGEPAFSGSR